MIAARLLDVLLVLLLLVFLGEGLRNGFARSISTIVGIVAGGVAAFFAIPLVAQLLPDPFWRTAATIGLVIALLAGGHAAGNAIGRAIAGRVAENGLGVVDRLLGALANLVTSALVMALIAGSVAALGIPLVSPAISGSVVLRAIDAITPEPLDAGLARLRTLVLEQGLPTIGEALGGIAESPGVPDVDTGTDALAVAAQSVVRISGTAYACGQNQSGTGFVIAPDRIVTNAHVVAGVPGPVVEAPNGQALDGRVVYFDPADDLAVIAVDGLTAAPLDLAAPLGPGDDAVVDGYPYGGPFTSGPAQVLAISTERLEDIYGSRSSTREVYTLAADIEPGNSGGPLLTTDGDVAGVVFARSATDDDLGYAMTNTELAPVAQRAPGLSTALEPGTCVRG
ncbi:MAG: MarP family serine protease [Microbacteriaceae bacterium]|nr:MarP family serine protease [Microbacteriaceae bacterium]